VAAYARSTRKTVNIADAYTAEGFDFSGTRKFDERTGYRSQSFLTVPMKNHENEVIGVLQLINAIDPEAARSCAFSERRPALAESLASQAAIALTNRQLIRPAGALFESFINLINLAIDEKSPYTGGHCQRVPALTMMLAEAVNATSEGPLADFTMSDKDRYELKIAGLLHDCGKVTTPVHVVDKATKLQTIFDRIDLIDTRFEVLKRDAEIAMLKPAAMEPREAAGPASEPKRIGRAACQVEDPTASSCAAQCRRERMQPRTRSGCGGSRAAAGATSTAWPVRFPQCRRARKPHHPRRYADAGRTRNHQPPHRRHHQDAGAAALAQASEERAGIRRRPP
jgi:hypothetical protein